MKMEKKNIVKILGSLFVPLEVLNKLENFIFYIILNCICFFPDRRCLSNF